MERINSFFISQQKDLIEEFMNLQAKYLKKAGQIETSQINSGASSLNETK
jgi:hypothetical protein